MPHKHDCLQTGNSKSLQPVSQTQHAHLPKGLCLQAKLEAKLNPELKPDQEFDVLLSSTHEGVSGFGTPTWTSLLCFGNKKKSSTAVLSYQINYPKPQTKSRNLYTPKPSPEPQSPKLPLKPKSFTLDCFKLHRALNEQDASRAVSACRAVGSGILWDLGLGLGSQIWIWGY